MFRKIIAPIVYLFSSEVPLRHRVLASCFPIAALITFASIINPPSSLDRKFVPIEFKEMPEHHTSEAHTEADQYYESSPDFRYEIKNGDNLSTIFSQLGFPYSDLLSVMEADLNFLKLDTLQPGNTLLFWGKNGESLLSKMVLEFNIADRAAYTRLSDNSFEYQDISLPGEWYLQPFSGEVHGSFSQSANLIGIGSVEIDQINTLLKDKLNFARDLRAGDKFEVIENRQFVDGKRTGKREIQAIRIYNRGRVISAFLHTDGQFYDQDGKSLQRAFQRYPTSSKYRISSGFNPKRKHPVTGRVSPHNGTDFATPTGTPVYSTGDGQVILTTNHPYAGKYVVIQHGAIYKTRYLHLSRILVKKGQKVSRGQKIALSGNTGRSTGPHLHYEFIIRDKAVNAMTANIPMASSVPKSEMAAFKARIAQYDDLLSQSLLVSN